MSNTTTYNALDLVTLSKVDMAIGKIIAETKEKEQSLKDKEAKVLKFKEKLKGRESALTEMKRSYDREESDLKFQQEKLTNRRKTLATLNNAKAQLVAEREIDSTAKLLSQREDKLLAVLTELETFENSLNEIKNGLAAAEGELKDLKDSLVEGSKLLAEQRAQKDAERAQLAASIPPDYLQRYETILRKYSMDPIVPILNNTCGGCSFKLVPQVPLNVARSNGPVQCPGCSRILYLDKTPQEQNFVAEQ